jgi:hypothetical protein
MPTFKISQLPAVTSIAGTEELEVNQAGTSRKATRTQIVAGLVSVGTVVSSGLTMNTARLLGRSTSSAGAVEEITLGENVFLNNGVLSASGGGGVTGVSSFTGGSTGLTPATSVAGSVTLGGTLNVLNGGTGAITATDARTNLGAAARGANSDITSITGLTTPLAVSQGGTGGATASAARSSLGLAIGTNVQAYSAQLDSVAAVSVNGLVARIAGSTVTPRTLTAGTGITVTNGSGVSGNPTIALVSPVAIVNGGTSATTAADARTQLGVPSLVTNTFTGTQTAPQFSLASNSARFWTSGGATNLNFDNDSSISYNGSSQYDISVEGATRLSIPSGDFALIADGFIRAKGYSSRAGTTGAYTDNLFNIQWSSPNASLYIDATNVGVIASVSDRRLKKEINDLSSSQEIVKALRPVSFRWRDEGLFEDTGVSSWGFIADEVQAVLPAAVVGEANAVAEDGSIKPQHILDRPIVAVLTKALQEALTRIDALEARIANLSRE